MPTTVDPNFPGAEKHEISLEEAREHVRRHTKSPIYPNHHGGSFDRGAIDKILAQKGCARFRIYHGKNVDGTPSLVLVGVDEAGKDMTQGCIMEMDAPCPPFCEVTSALLA